MTTAVDSNVFISLWSGDDEVNRLAETALDECAGQGRLIICPAVYCELAASPGRDEGFVSEFLRETRVVVDWDLDEGVWRLAGEAFRDYAARRRKRRDGGPRRLLADFLIGAHAVRRANRLLTSDEKVFRAAYPGLNTVTL